MLKTRLVAIYVLIIILIFFSFRCGNTRVDDLDHDYNYQYYKRNENLDEQLKKKEQQQVKKIEISNNTETEVIRRDNTEDNKINKQIESREINKKDSTINKNQTLQYLQTNSGRDAVDPEIDKRKNSKENIYYLLTEFKKDLITQIKDKSENDKKKEEKNKRHIESKEKNDYLSKLSNILEKVKNCNNEINEKIKNQKKLKNKTKFELEGIEFFIFNALSLDFIPFKNEASSKTIICKIKYNNSEEVEEINFILDYSNFLKCTKVSCYLDKGRKLEIFRLNILPSLEYSKEEKAGYKVQIQNLDSTSYTQDKTILKIFLESLGFLISKKNIENTQTLIIQKDMDTKVNLFKCIYGIFKYFDKKLCNENTKNTQDEEGMQPELFNEFLLDYIKSSISKDENPQKINGHKENPIQNPGNFLKEQKHNIKIETKCKKNRNIKLKDRCLQRNNNKNEQPNICTKSINQQEVKKNNNIESLLAQLLKKVSEKNDTVTNSPSDSGNSGNSGDSGSGGFTEKYPLFMQKKQNNIKENNIREEKNILKEDISGKKISEKNIEEEKIEREDYEDLVQDKIYNRKQINENLSKIEGLDKRYYDLENRIFKKERIIKLVKEKIAKIEKMDYLIGQDIEFLEKWENKIPLLEKEVYKMLLELDTLMKDIFKEIKNTTTIISEDIIAYQKNRTELKVLYNSLKNQIKDNDTNKVKFKNVLEGLTNTTKSINYLKNKKKNLDKMKEKRLSKQKIIQSKLKSITEKDEEEPERQDKGDKQKKRNIKTDKNIPKNERDVKQEKLNEKTNEEDNEEDKEEDDGVEIEKPFLRDTTKNQEEQEENDTNKKDDEILKEEKRNKKSRFFKKKKYKKD